MKGNLNQKTILEDFLELFHTSHRHKGSFTKNGAAEYFHRLLMKKKPDYCYERYNYENQTIITYIAYAGFGLKRVFPID
ncbi:MAG: hypothetical protein CVU39_07135 [Chloroflexi bacterium HGW-Chloroflexi-10]|nr:MAG: hypothetical protein CVU39_07135 [Chloroflexi bacterium HGW-Chloroflexi-10]